MRSSTTCLHARLHFSLFTHCLARVECHAAGMHVDGCGLRGVGGVSKRVAQAMFDGIDSEGNGRLSFAEFSAALLKLDE